MKNYYTDYVNHMLRVYYAAPTPLTPCEQLNVAAVKEVLEKKKCSMNQELLNECLRYVYMPPCEDFTERIEQFAAMKSIRTKDVYAILAKVARCIATERGLI